MTPGGPDSAEHCCLLVDLSSGPLVTATLGWSWRPNQPERGVLGLTRDGLGEVVLQPGQSVDVRPGRHLLEVEVAAEVVGPATRVAPSGADSWGGVARGVRVRQIAGVHLLYRDEMHVADAPADAAVHCRRGSARLDG